MECIEETKPKIETWKSLIGEAFRDILYEKASAVEYYANVFSR